MNENNVTIQRYVSDMLSMVRHVQEAVDRQKTDDRVVRIEDAHSLLQKISLALNSQSGELRRVMAQYGDGNGSREGLVDQTVSTAKEVVASTLGQAAGLIGMVRPDKVSLMLRDDYTAMNMTAIGYTMLHTTAVVLHDELVAGLAAEHLNDITPLIIEINEVVPRIVAMELLDEAASVDLGAVDQAILNTQAAWTAEHVHMGHQHSWEENNGEMRDPSARHERTQEPTGQPGATWTGSDQPGMPPQRDNPTGAGWQGSDQPGMPPDRTNPPAGSNPLDADTDIDEMSPGEPGRGI